MLAQGWTGQARESLTRAAERRTTALGEGHADTLASRHRLGEALRALGSLEEALAVHSATLDTRLRLYCAEHRLTLRTREALAIAYKAMGRTDEAIVIPAATALASSRSSTPEEPCSTRGTSSAALSRAMRSKSRTTSRVSMACELPTATASASAHVDAANARASSGSVRTPGACAPSLPPASPSSASTYTSARWQCSVTSRVAATFAS